MPTISVCRIGAGKHAAVDLSSVSAQAVEECCRHCQATRDCLFFTFVPRDRLCYLKRQSGEEVADESSYGLISGSMKIMKKK
jgi:hypothetical protein